MFFFVRYRWFKIHWFSSWKIWIDAAILLICYRDIYHISCSSFSSRLPNFDIWVFLVHFLVDTIYWPCKLICKNYELFQVNSVDQFASPLLQPFNITILHIKSSVFLISDRPSPPRGFHASVLPWGVMVYMCSQAINSCRSDHGPWNYLT